MTRMSRCLGAAALACTLFAPAAQAGLFDDDEARRAILDLRQKLEQSNEQQRARQAELNAQMADQLAQLKRSLLDLNSQLELLRADNAKLRGQEEQWRANVPSHKRKARDRQQESEHASRRFKRQKRSAEAMGFMTAPADKRLHDGPLRH